MKKLPLQYQIFYSPEMDKYLESISMNKNNSTNISQKSKKQHQEPEVVKVE
jgi:hypothetical protein